MEKKGLRVNAGMTKIIWCKVSMDQAVDILESIHVVFVGRELVTTQSCVECFRWVHKRCGGMAFQES